MVIRQQLCSRTIDTRGRQFLRKLEFQAIHLGKAVVLCPNLKNNFSFKISLKMSMVWPLKVLASALWGQKFEVIKSKNSINIFFLICCKGQNNEKMSKIGWYLWKFHKFHCISRCSTTRAEAKTLRGHTILNIKDIFK